MTAPSLIPFASLVLETPQFQWAHWHSYLETYLQDGGGFALLGIWVWIVATFLRSVSPQGRRGRRRSAQPSRRRRGVAGAIFGGRNRGANRCIFIGEARRVLGNHG